MWLIISTPSNPASLMACIFSSTDPLIPTVAHMMPFLMERFAAGGFSWARRTAGARVERANRLLPVARKSRRIIVHVNLVWTVTGGVGNRTGVFQGECVGA